MEVGVTIPGAVLLHSVAEQEAESSFNPPAAIDPTRVIIPDEPAWVGVADAEGYRLVGRALNLRVDDDHLVADVEMVKGQPKPHGFSVGVLAVPGTDEWELIGIHALDDHAEVVAHAR